MPYLTEELWQKLPGTSSVFHNAAYASAEATIMLADFPMGDAALIDETAEAEMSLVIETIRRVRNIRTEMNIRSSDRVAVHVAADEGIRETLAANEAQILKLARADKLVLAETLDVPKASAKAVITNAEIAVPLEGLIDFDKERARLAGQIEKLATEAERLDAQLLNPNFVEKAPAEKVEALRERKAEIAAQLLVLDLNIEALK
jgi:valyl-tRNA synthetase